MTVKETNQTSQVRWVAHPERAVLERMAADEVLQTLRTKDRPVFGFATGGTPLGVYRELVQSLTADASLQRRWKQVVAFNLDEYVGLDSNHPQSYHKYMYENLYAKVPLPEDQIHIPEGIGNLEENTKAYEEKLASCGWTDLQILGIGPNGHIGFNEPADDLVLDTHVTSLSDVTRKANARFFESVDEVPEAAITMGMRGILRAKRILLLAFGEEKRAALERAFSGSITTQCPATFLQLHPDVTVFTDQELSYSRK